MGRDAARRWLLAGAIALVPVGLVLVGGHRGSHAARSMLVPGAGLLEAQPALAGVFLVAAVAATVAWLRWGADWLVLTVVVAAMAASAVWGTVDHPVSSSAAVPVARAAHEFPVVVLIIGALGWARAVLGRVPGFGRLRGRAARDGRELALADLSPVDRCRAAAFLALSGAVDDDLRVAITSPDVARRAARVGLVARFRRGGDPFRVDHAHARAALALTGASSPAAVELLAADARRRGAGAPASEPGWVRLLDATLVSVALDERGDPEVGRRWAATLDGPFAARRGHRPAWWWTPLGVAAGRALDWEHAAATALAHQRGWIDADDWPLLRRRVLGAAARGSTRRDDERLIAAGRLWLALVDDPAAERIVARPTVRHDPLARALDAHAAHVRAAAVADTPAPDTPAPDMASPDASTPDVAIPDALSVGGAR
ncbi:MAG: hypothetical protein S0880_09595 [Actinomycetota bacterium]|nr:hypothetical protein [Actinomycetota bacterium]